jgi:hypothetical protein
MREDTTKRERILKVGIIGGAETSLQQLQSSYPNVPILGAARFGVLVPCPEAAPAKSGPIKCMHCGRGGGTLVRVGRKGKDAKYKHKGCG